MAITNEASLTAAMKWAQEIRFVKVGLRIGAIGNWADSIDIAGSPLGVLAGSSTTAGVVPVSGDTGFPTLDGFNGLTGYLAAIEFVAFFSTRTRLVDLLWKAGAYPFNANVVLSSQPSFAARVPNGDYAGTQLWFCAATAFTGNPTVTITYTNQDGVAGRTSTLSMTAPPIGIMYQMPLQAGDTGVQLVESVVSAVASVGTFNVYVTRPLWHFGTDGLITTAGGVAEGVSMVYGPDKTGLPVVFETSALAWFAGCGVSTLAFHSNGSELTVYVVKA